jgi:hypothetical protein
LDNRLFCVISDGFKLHFSRNKEEEKRKKTRKRKLGLKEGESGMKNKSAFTLGRKQNFIFH